MPGSSAFAVVDQAKNNLKKLETYISTGMDNCVDLSLDIVEHDPGNCDGQIAELKALMLDYIKMQVEQKQFLEATEAAKQQAQQSDEPVDMSLLLDANLKEQGVETTKELQNHDRFVDFINKIEELKAAEGATGGLDTEKEPTQIDDDIAMTQEVITKCPYTGKEMKDPVQNTLCKHNYEKQGIQEAMKLRKGRTKCPVPGCINDKPISDSHLENNQILRRFIEKQNRLDKRGKKT